MALPLVIYCNQLCNGLHKMQMMGEMMHEEEEVNHVILMQEKWQAVEEKVYSSGQ